MSHMMDSSRTFMQTNSCSEPNVFTCRDIETFTSDRFRYDWMPSSATDVLAIRLKKKS